MSKKCFWAGQVPDVSGRHRPIARVARCFTEIRVDTSASDPPRGKKSNEFASGRAVETVRRNGFNSIRPNTVACPKRRFGGRETGFETVETYRLYCLDGVGKVASAEWFEAVDDKAAIQIAERLRGGRACEIWQNSRLVGRFERKGTA